MHRPAIKHACLVRAGAKRNKRLLLSDSLKQQEPTQRRQLFSSSRFFYEANLPQALDLPRTGMHGNRLPFAPPIFRDKSTDETVACQIASQGGGSGIASRQTVGAAGLTQTGARKSYPYGPEPSVAPARRRKGAANPAQPSPFRVSAFSHNHHPISPRAARRSRLPNPGALTPSVHRDSNIFLRFQGSEFFSLVMFRLSDPQPKKNFYPAVLPVELQGDQSPSLEGRRSEELSNLRFMKQELPRRFRIAGREAGSVRVNGNVRLKEPRLSPLDLRIGSFELSFSLPERFYLRPRENQSSFVGFEEDVIPSRTAIHQ